MCRRAYILFLIANGEESKAGPNIRVVDAATAYEEVAKARKLASPAKASKGARERPGPGRALPDEGAKLHSSASKSGSGQLSTSSCDSATVSTIFCLVGCMQHSSH